MGRVRRIRGPRDAARGGPLLRTVPGARTGAHHCGITRKGHGTGRVADVRGAKPMSVQGTTMNGVASAEAEAEVRPAPAAARPRFEARAAGASLAALTSVAALLAA